jgi:hypothetical protein
MNEYIEMYSINVLCTRKMFSLTFKSAKKLWTIYINVWTLMSIFSYNGHVISMQFDVRLNTKQSREQCFI